MTLVEILKTELYKKKYITLADIEFLIKGITGEKKYKMVTADRRLREELREICYPVYNDKGTAIIGYSLKNWEAKPQEEKPLHPIGYREANNLL